MKRKNLLLLCVIAMIAICLAACSNLPELPGSDKLPGCLELYGSHDVKHVEAKDATCTNDGNIEYWYCAACGTVWSDSANTQQIDKASTVVAQLEHEYTYACDQICVHCGELTNEEAEHTIAHVNAKDATCAEPGNIEYWYCTDCGYAWADAALTKVTNLKSVILPELECNLTHFEAVAPACHYIGNIEYWVCNDCDRVWQDAACTQLTNRKNVILPATGNGLLVHMDAVAPGCHDTGCIEHWICYTCEQVWQDEALTQLTNIKNVILPALGGEVVHVEATEAYCHQNGNIEHWYCETCEKVWQDEALTQLTNHKNVIIGCTAAIEYVEAVAPTCHQTGNVEYWFCTECDAVFTDAALTQLSNRKNVIIPALNELTYVPAVKAECHQNGSSEYWYCAECDAVFADAAGRYLTNRKNLTLVHTADVEYVEAVAPTCHQTGNNEYWFCTECDAVFTDAALTQLSNRKNVIIPALNELTYVPAVEAGCHQNGVSEYWFCSECDAVFADAAGRYLTNRKNLTVLYTSEIKYVAAKAATCTENGNNEYWYCADCQAVFTDAALTQLTNFKRVVIPALGHSVAYECDKKCQVCFEVVNAEAAHKAVLVPAKDSTCTVNGNVVHYACEYCGNVWYDKALTQSLSKNDVTLPLAAHEYRFECDANCMNCYEFTNENAAHNIVFVEAKAPTCIAFGNIEHYACTYCAGCWDNAEGTGMPLNKMMVNISKVEHEALSPCYPECKWCFQPVFETNGHDVKHVEAKDKTCLEAGCLEHWICANCNTVWVDEALTETVRYADVMIPTLGYHSYNYECDTACAVCQLETRTDRTHEYFYACDKVCMHCFKETNPTADHTVLNAEAVDPTCHQTGNVEYWYCKDCNTVWADEALRYQTNAKNVIIPALNNLTYVAEVPASCHQNGCQEYWFCEVCDAVFADAAGIQLTNRKNLTLVYTAEIAHVDAVEVSCHQNGNVEYWYCTDCLAVFTDVALTKLSNFKSVVIPYTAEIKHVAAVEASCHQNGNVEYWYCADCNAVFTDVTLTKLSNFKSVVTPYTAEIVYVEAKAATCTENGNNEYWYCAGCQAVFTDAALTQLSNFKRVVIPALGHSYFYACDAVCQVCYEVTKNETHEIVHVAAKAATCTENGNIEYWYCEICGSAWSNEALTQVTNRRSVVVPATGHDYFYACDAHCMNCGELTNPEATHTLVHVAAKAATCTVNGNIEYWYCENCGSAWSNEALTQVTNRMNVVVPAAGHTGLDDLVCDECEEFIMPEAGSTLTIPQALALAKKAGSSYTKDKYYITGIVTNVYNTTYGNMYLKDADGNKICIYGLYEWGTNGKRYDAMSYKPVEGDELTVYTVLGMYNTTCQGKNAWIDEVVAHEHDYDSVVTEPTCTKGGYTTHTCSICDGYYKDAETEATGHTTTNGVCGNCGLTIGGDVVNNETFTADFNTVTGTSTSYVTSTTTSGWKAVNAAVFKGGTSDSSPAFKMIGDASNRAFCMNGKTSAKGSITSSTISGGISELSLKYGLPFGDTKIGFTINIKQNGVVVASKTVTNNSASKLTAYTLNWDLAGEGVAVSGDFVIEILNNSPSNSTSNKDRTAIWDVQWTTNY